MKKELVAFLRCPACFTELTLKTDVCENGEILSGQLICPHQHQFQIQDGVPRFVDPSTTLDSRTREVFGSEWTTFGAYNAPNLALMTDDLDRNFFSGRLVLDAGCGGGRHSQELKTVWGAKTVIGVDFSNAVLTAVQWTKDHAGIHIVQASIYDLPFEKNFFGVVFCLGVLQHLPDPRGAVSTLVECLKPGGRVVLWVYKKSLRKQLLEIPRTITKRLPVSLQHVFSWVAAVLFYPGVLAFRHLRLPLPSHFREYAKHDWSIYRTDWYDRLSAPMTAYYDEDEIACWFSEESLENVQISSYKDFFIRGIGTKF